MEKKKDYSVITPVFNSESMLDELFQRIKSVFDKLGKTFEVIFVDDGSMDGSWKKLQQIKQEDEENVTVIKLSRNFGQHNATFCGFHFAKGDYLITIDDDLQNPPEEIVKLIDSQEEHETDLVYGAYKKKQHSYVRNMGSRYAKKSIKRLLKRESEGSSLRLITRELIEKILQHHHYFVYIDELLRWYTDNISWVEVKHMKRPAGKSGYNTFSLFRYVANAIIYYTSIPLKLMVYGGFFASIIFFIISIYYILLKLILDVPLGYTSIIVGIMFSTSLILFCLGIIGEYLSRIYMVQNKKPPYSIKKILS